VEPDQVASREVVRRISLPITSEGVSEFRHECRAWDCGNKYGTRATGISNTRNSQDFSACSTLYQKHMPKTAQDDASKKERRNEKTRGMSCRRRRTRRNCLSYEKQSTAALKRNTCLRACLFEGHFCLIFMFHR
jgi:hypothetical protein